MTEIIPRALLVRLGFICLAAAALWITLVKPAQADLDADLARLADQQAEISAHLSGRAELTDLQQTAKAINQCAAELQQGLEQHSKSKRLLGEIERVASMTGVRVDRSKPIGSVRVPHSPNDTDPVEVFADRVSVEFAGSYDAARRFLFELQHGIGIANLSGLRIVPAGEQRVTGTVELQVFRLGPKASVVPQETPREAQADES